MQNIISNFWSEHNKDIYASTFKEYKSEIDNDIEVAKFFSNIVDYKVFSSELENNLIMEADYFSGIELNLTKLPVTDQKNNEEILDISSKILMNISLIEGKYKELTNKALVKAKIISEETRKQIIKNTLSENKELLKTKSPSVYNVLKQIKFFKLINDLFGNRIRNDFGHGKVHFFINASNQPVVVQHLKSLNTLLVTLTQYIHAISVYLINPLGSIQGIPYYPLNHIMRVSTKLDKYYIMYEINRSLKAWNKV